MKQIRDFVRRNPHVWWALVLPVYLALFFFMEAVVPTQGYWATQLPIDNHIPFLEGFVVFYAAWAPVLVAVGLWLLIKDGENFTYYMWTLAITFLASTLFCLLVPNGQDLRPEVLPRDNIFCTWVGIIYALDTNTNVFPSVHVVGVMAALFALWHSETTRKWRWPALLLGVLIILSTLFIHQHAVLDVAASLVLSAVTYGIVYGLLARRKGGRYGRR